MMLAHSITRMPRPFDADRAGEVRDLFPDLTGPVAELVVGAGASSPYLMGLMQRERAWVVQAFEDPHSALHMELERQSGADFRDIATVLRQGKRRVALLLALLDLGGVWPLLQITAALSGFADQSCDLALKAALAPLLQKGKVPGQSLDDLPGAAGMTVLAMGKMGAGELNYSSDIDLICLFDETRFDPEDYHEARSAFVKATRLMCKTLSDVTSDGYVFRTDLRLRPNPSVTPVVMATEAAERYYESLGRTWERAAYIKARPCAGDLGVGSRFLENLAPFVWRKHLDFAAIEDAHNMRLAIREHKGTGGPITLPGHNMKLGRGGIREIEFFTQTRQLIAGGRDPALRVRETLVGLDRLVNADWVPKQEAEQLEDSYVFHRDIEHRLQMVQDAQTHDLPTTKTEFERLACLSGVERSVLEAELRDRLSTVHRLTEGFFAPSEPRTDADVTSELLTADVLARWLTFPALRSPRARGILERLKPSLDAALSRADSPQEALLAFEGFISGLPAGVQVLSLFEANPQLVDLVLDVAATSPALRDHLGRNSSVLDAVIGGGFFQEWPDQETLRQDLHAELNRVMSDYEATLDTARRWAKEWHFRIGVHVLRGLTDPDSAARQYTALARAILAEIWPVVTAQFAIRHGAAPGRGATILGMGALGAATMTPGSDLDIIVIYDADGQESSEGQRPLASRMWYARATQALITALTAPMAQGRLYEVDMRLRPSGNQGPVATSWQSFQSYQMNEAWTWEHLALTRALVVAGDEELGDDVEIFRQSILGKACDPAKIAGDISDMRSRIASAKPITDVLSVKVGRGRMQDIDLVAQMGTLLAGGSGRDTVSGLNALVDFGVLTRDDADRLEHAHHFYRNLQMARRLLGRDRIDPEQLGKAGQDFLFRATHTQSFADLRATLDEWSSQSAARIDNLLATLTTAGPL